MRRVLILQSDSMTAEFLYRYLARNGIKAVEEVSYTPDPQDVVVVDNTATCRRIRQFSAAPILALTEDKPTARIRALDAGADLVLSRPVHYEELVAALTALWRRVGRAKGTLTCGDVELDADSFSVTRGERTIDLGPKEFAILEFLLRFKDHTIPTNRLLREVWGYVPGETSNVVAVTMRSLRRKLGDPPLVITVRGFGYKLRRRDANEKSPQDVQL